MAALDAIWVLWEAVWLLCECMWTLWECIRVVCKKTLKLWAAIRPTRLPRAAICLPSERIG